jgi:predicted MFS family arabinose efflux permease
VRSIVLSRLLSLALATFAVGTDSFVIAGLLPAIARDLHVTVPAAGQLVTAFALTFAVAAPVLGALTSSLNRRTALILALGVFVLGNVASALGGTYEIVLAARILTAAGAGIITSTASSAAVAITPPERRGRALAFVIGGLTISSVFGVPIGTIIGGTNWRATLWLVAGLGIAALLTIAVGLPGITLPAASLRDRLSHLKDRWILSVLVVSVAALAGTYVLFTYVGAAVAHATGGSAAKLTLVMLAVGIGTTVGNFLAGRFADSHRPEHVLIAGLGGATIVSALSVLVLDSLVATLIWAVVLGLFGGVPTVPQQHRLVSRAPAAAPVLLGLNSSAIYLGMALGGGLGGVAQNWIAPNRLGIVSAVIFALAVTLAVATARRATSSVPSVQPQ